MERLRVRVHTPTHIFTGYVRRLPQQRLLNILNGILTGTMRVDEAFLPFKEVSVGTHRLDGKEVALKCAYINKADILFAREIDEGQPTEHGEKVEPKLYPFVSKSPMRVKLFMSGYTLTGQMHCAEGHRLGDVLKSATRFLPLTGVEIRSSAGSSESGLSFVAVNKEQIICLEEVGDA